MPTRDIGIILRDAYFRISASLGYLRVRQVDAAGTPLTSFPVTGTVAVSSEPALAATTDAVTSKLATDAIQNGLTALTPKFAFANVAASQTDANVITAVGGKKLRVLAALFMAAATATTVTFNSKGAVAGTAISATFPNGANGGACPSFNPVGWFETNSGEALTVTTGAGSTTAIQVTYVEV